MNPKIKKLCGELNKNKAKIADLQAQNKELEKQIRELENTDIVGMVREQGLTPEQLAELLRSLQNAPPAPEPKKEDNPIEQV